MKLEVHDLTAGYSGRPVLERIEFAVPEGSITTLLGANGSGKSTLLKVIGRLLKPKSGAVLLDGKRIHSMDTAALARELALLPQLHHAPGRPRYANWSDSVAFPTAPGWAVSPDTTGRWSKRHWPGPASPNWRSAGSPPSPAGSASAPGSP